jgi:leucyl aminopeptidase (aminopeptidase T)
VPSTRPPPRSKTPLHLRLHALDFDLAQAARRVVEGSLGVVAGDRIVVIVDEAREALGSALCEAALAVGGQPEVAVLERLGRRPLRAAPPALRSLLENAQASVLLIGFEDGEWEMRNALVTAVTELSLRHAHMVGLGRKAMLTGFSVDPQRVLDATRAVRTRLRPDSVLHLRSPLGSDLTVKLDPATRWQERVGLIRPGRWENLPSGELFTCPADVEGVYVASASLGGAVGAAAGVLERTPVRFEIKGGVCKGVQCADRALAGGVESALRAERNGDRVGMLVLGTNVGIRDATGEVLCDQNLPGLHLGFGATFSQQTGATWDSPSQMLVTATGGDVDLDGAPLLRSGRYLVL